MKKFSIKLVSIITAAMVTSGFLGTSLPAVAAMQPTNTDIAQGLAQLKATSEAVGGMYATNPSGVGKNATIKIDGSFSDWSDDMLIAQGVANDEPRTFNGSHEYPVYDDYALYAAWDDTNLYVGWQIANPNDVTCGQNGVGTNEAKPYNADMPQMIALDIHPGLEGTSLLADGKYIWGKSIQYANGIDTLLYFSSKTGAVGNGPGSGVGSAGLFKVNEGTGMFSYDPGDCTLFKEEGIKYASVDGFLPKTMMGINGVADLGVDALYSSASPWTDLLKTNHKTSLDTFYEMAIPLKSLGIDKNYIESNGIGVMHVSAYGSSATNTLPHDKAVLDNALLPYTQDPSSSNEKEDLDILTVPTARVGKAGNSPIVVKPIISSFTADKTSPQEAGTAINFNTVGTSGTGTLTYQYEVNSTVAKAFSSSASFAWTPSIAGNYTIKVTVKDANGVTATSTQIYVVSETKSNPLVVNSFTTSKDSPQAVSTAITLNALATGGTGTIQYKYLVNGTLVKNYSTDSSYTWTPQSSGTYNLALYIKDGTDKEIITNKSYEIKANNTLVISNFSGNIASPLNAGTAITLSASATGGEGALQTQFAVFNGSRWELIKGYSTVQSAVWTPTVAGTYRVDVNVKDQAGKVETKSLTYVVKHVSSQLEIKSFNTSVVSPQNVGTAITLSASATGGEGALQTQFAVFNGYKWLLVKSYSTAQSAVWTPTEAGTYRVDVNVKDQAGKVETKSLTYVVKGAPAITIESISADKLSPQDVGTTIKLTTKATSSNALQYRYWVYDSEGNWTALNTFSVSNTINWVPKTSGVQLIFVDVIDTKGNITNKRMTYIVK